MSLDKVKSYFAELGMEERVKEFHQSSATVELAAQALGCKPERIAKTMSFLLGEQPILIVTAGDAKVDNKKYKEQFHQKARMIPAENVEQYIGHAPGGVCPFVVLPGVQIFLDESLKRFDIVYPAAGSANSAVELSPAELETCCVSQGWVNVCKGWEAEMAGE
ncbi:MAG: YbaK/EbsC family protein [bacterium]|nr:YbaK/EbsC family protein [bacterium]